jgi:hypothetical protein
VFDRGVFAPADVADYFGTPAAVAGGPSPAPARRRREPSGR